MNRTLQVTKKQPTLFNAGVVVAVIKRCVRCDDHTIYQMITWNQVSSGLKKLSSQQSMNHCQMLESEDPLMIKFDLYIFIVLRL